MVRSLVISLRQREFVLRHGFPARAMCGCLSIIWQARDPLAAGAGDAGYRPYDAARPGMSFLGLGVTAPTAEWGVMLTTRASISGPSRCKCSGRGCAVYQRDGL